MNPAYRSVLALLVAVFFMVIGNGLLNTLVPIRAKLEGFDETGIGLLGSAYFAGMLLGAVFAPALVRRAGHIRSLALSVAIGTIASLAFAVDTSALTWMTARFATGFCFAGLYATVESWLQGKAENAIRGRVLGIYSVIQFSAWAVGAQAVNLADPQSFALFSLIAVAMTASIIPLAVTTSAPPEVPARASLRLKWLFQVSPIGFVCTLLIGAANGPHWSLAPTYGGDVGMTVAQITNFMTMMTIGSAVLQMPVGKLSDMSDRRYVLVVMLAGTIAVEVALALFGEGIGIWGLYALAFIIGGTMSTQYYIVGAHTNDRTGPQNAVSVAAALLLLYCVGAIIGPVTAAALMKFMGPSGLFWHNAVIHAVMIVFVIWRIYSRPRPAETIPATPPTVRATPSG